MFKVRSAIALIVLVPSVVLAQGRSKGMGKDTKSADWDAVQKSANSGMKLSNKDVEGTSPIKLLLDKKKDLKLSEDVVKKLKDVDAADKEKNKDLFKSLDSLRGETKPSGVEPNDADRIRAQMAVSLATSVVKDVRANYAASFQSALPLLDDSQKAMANDWAQKLAQESDDMLRDKLGGRGGRGDGPPGDAPPGGSGVVRRGRGSAQ